MLVNRLGGCLPAPDSRLSATGSLLARPGPRPHVGAGLLRRRRRRDADPAAAPQAVLELVGLVALLVVATEVCGRVRLADLHPFDVGCRGAAGCHESDSEGDADSMR